MSLTETKSLFGLCVFFSYNLKVFFKIFGIVLLIFTMIFLYAYYYESNKFETKEYLIKDVNIPDEFNGIKILHITDILYGKNINKDIITEISEEIKLIKPDIVIFTGNIISKDYKASEEEIKLLNTFFNNISYTIGKYAVNGDIDTRNFNLIMEHTNFTMLENELINIYHGTNKINMIGISYDETKEIKNDNETFTITIINNYDDYNKYNIQSDLVFAGHNLGGEIKLFGLPLLGHDKHKEAYYEENNAKIYISNGLGSPHHLRLMNKPSMNIYRLYNK